MNSLIALCLAATAFAAEMNHAGHAMEKDEAKKFPMSAWTEFTVGTKDQGDYWMVGKYGSHLDKEGKMYFDNVNQLFASTKVGLKTNWSY